MTLKQIADDWLGKTAPYPEPDPYEVKGQCVQFIRYLLRDFYKKSQWRPRAGAADFWNSYDTDTNIKIHFEKIPNTPDFIPQEGDIVIWNKNKGGGYGHIAVVYGDKQSVKKMTCLEQNWKPLIVSIEEHDYKDVLGFFRLRESL
jgi:cell wall-associated NlpC family hydrolase